MVSKKTDIWFPLYVNDYLGDTASLSTVEHGIYLLLLIECFKKGSIPADISKIRKIAKLSNRFSNESLMNVLNSYFVLKCTSVDVLNGPDVDVLKSQFYTNKRMTEEREKANKISNSASEKAKKRWKKDDAGESSGHMPQKCQSQSQSQSHQSINPDRQINATINSPKTNSIHQEGTIVRTSSYGLGEEKIVEFDSETADMIISTFYGKDEISDSAKLKAYEQIQKYLTKRDSLKMDELLEATINYVEFWLDKGFDPEKPNVRRCTVFENYLKKDNLTYFLEGYEEGKGKSDSVKISESKSKNFKSVKKEMDAILQGAK